MGPREDPVLRRYRKVIAVSALALAAAIAGVGVWLLLRGRAFHGVLALLVVAYLVLVVRGYTHED